MARVGGGTPNNVTGIESSQTLPTCPSGIGNAYCDVFRKVCVLGSVHGTINTELVGIRLVEALLRGNRRRLLNLLTAAGNGVDTRKVEAGASLTVHP
jgi:hypothetical protein